MDFGFSEEEELFRKTVRQFSERKLRPKYAERDRPDYPVYEMLREMAGMDLLGLRTPAEYGGSDASYVTAGIGIEETARGDYNVSGYLLSNMLMSEIISKYGTKVLKDTWLPELVAGRRECGIALTEPHCGSDAVALTTRAVRDGDEYVLTGEKSSTSHIDADGFIVFCRTSPLQGSRGVSAILVPRDTAGLARSRFNDLGMRMHRRGALHLDGARVSAANLIGEEGHGFHMVMNEFDYARAIVALQCLGAALQTVEETIEYTKTRTAFGQPIARFEGVSFPIAEALTRIEAARLLSYKALWLRDRGLAHGKEAAMAKWFGTQLAFETIHQMLLLHGHAGYSDEYAHAQRLRDVIGQEIGDGPPQIMKLIICREVLGREFRPQ